jgi:hypothetical protein
MGKQSFPDGTFSGLAAALAECKALEVYLCPECGRVEFFAENVGEEFRRDL